MTSNAELLARWDTVMMRNYGTPPIALVRGKGCTVWDADDKPYLDLLGGIAVSSLGHAHPAVVEAVSRQVATLAHTSNLYVNEPAVALAERLVSLVDAPARVFLANDGTGANEAAIKVALRHGGPGRTRFVAAERSFHGRTLGALALTGKAAIRDPFGPLPLDVTFVPYGDAEVLAAAVDDRTAAVFLEPTLGEAGVVPPPAGYLAAARAACDAHGALLVLDEVQGGIGRSGAWLAHQHDGVSPDVVTLAKGLGAGLPVGACIAMRDAATALQKGDHGSTFAGNPVSAVAAIAVLDTIEKEHLLDHVAGLGDAWASALRAVRHPLVAGVRGRGLWLAIELAEPVSAAVEAAAREHGFLVNAPAPDAIRLAPPLVLTHQEADRFVEALPAILAGASTTVRVDHVTPEAPAHRTAVR